MIRKRHAGQPVPEETPLPADPAHARAILDAALDAVVTIDHRGHVLEFNRAAEETFGYRREDVLGKELASLVVPPDAREAHRRALERWTAEGPGPGAGGLLGRRIEVEAMRADGSPFPAELAISRVEVPGPPVFTACLREISDRKAGEDKLRAAELRYRTLVEQLPLAVYVDRADRVSSNLYTSPQIEAMLGYSAEEWMADPSSSSRSSTTTTASASLRRIRGRTPRGSRSASSIGSTPATATSCGCTTRRASSRPWRARRPCSRVTSSTSARARRPRSSFAIRRSMIR